MIQLELRYTQGTDWSKILYVYKSLRRFLNHRLPIYSMDLVNGAMIECDIATPSY